MKYPFLPNKKEQSTCTLPVISLFSLNSINGNPTQNTPKKKRLLQKSISLLKHLTHSSGKKHQLKIAVPAI
jgi:hypothetical protein